MKTIIKHISLLIWSGLIIPCCFICGIKWCNTPAETYSISPKLNLEAPEPSFNLMRDVVAKLLPVVKNFN